MVIRRGSGVSMFQKGTGIGARWTYALLGLVLGSGAPVGQLLLRMLTSPAVRKNPVAEVRNHLPFYGYQILGTSAIFCIAGMIAGQRAERLQRAEQFYHRLSEHDSLTGLLNARAFGDKCARVLERAVKLEQPVSMLLIDIDGLKEINDSFGHAAGSDALLHVARIIDQSKRSEDSAARWGGDEFAILLEGGDVEAATRVGDSIIARLRLTPLSIGRQQRTVTVTIGIATSGHPVHAAQLFEAADHALYEGKRLGRDRVAWAPSLPS
ncbi:MAG: GGDEF domain-containing protein [Acidobacteriota bacterium]